MTNLTAHGFEVKKDHLCDCCGEEKATKVIMDPNKFPNNDPTDRADTWDVCDACKTFVEQGVHDSYAFMGLMVIGKDDEGKKAVEKLGKDPQFARAYDWYKDVKKEGQ